MTWDWDADEPKDVADSPEEWLISLLESTRPTRRLCDARRDRLRAMMPSAWVEDALCARVDPEAWFPEKGRSASAQVFSICASCPVRPACLAMALFGNAHGIWAGTTAKDREDLYQLIEEGMPVESVVELGVAAGPRGLRRSMEPRVAS